MRIFINTLLVGLVCQSVFAKNFRDVAQLNSIDELKTEIIKIAEQFKGLGDPELQLQNQLVPYVEKLIKLNPMPPIKDRITTLAGRWQQVWGPYEYRKNDRSVDPTTDPDTIYQVVFEEGYYWNVGHVLDKKTKEVKRITLLRGEFNAREGNNLDVRFTRLKGLKPHKKPANLTFTDLPALAETNHLEGMRTVLPNFLVRTFFGGGTLVEVYTDQDLRLAYGTNSREFTRPYLYVLKRVQ